MELIDGINCIYGPPSSGKTNICHFLAANTKGKVIFIDPENTFSAKRIRDFNKDVDLDNICLIKADSFAKQNKIIQELELLKKVDLIIIDSMTKYYRKEFQEKTHPDLAGQLKLLRNLYKSKGCKVLMTSQVYSTEDNKIMPVGGKLIRDFSKQLVVLSHERKRVMSIIKPEQKELEFCIETGNISFSAKTSQP